MWNGQKPVNCKHPKYLGVTLDRSLTFKKHIQNCKTKVNTRNNILRKLTSSQWGVNPNTLRTSALALCYSAAEYACPVWSQSSHAKYLDPALNDSCRIITGCPNPTKTNCLYLLAGIAPPDIRREVVSRGEMYKAKHDLSHMLYGSQAAKQILKSRQSFLYSTTPLSSPSEETRLELWKDRLRVSVTGKFCLKQVTTVQQARPGTVTTVQQARPGTVITVQQAKPGTGPAVQRLSLKLDIRERSQG